MLASVTQRTREIGIRMAVGATSLSIELQFLAEAVTLGLAGGLAGIVGSWIGASGAGQMLDWPISISLRAVVVAIVASVAAGLCSGLYPAWRAAHMDPIEALRHE